MKEYIEKIKKLDSKSLKIEYEYLVEFAETDEDFYKLEKLKEIIANRICKIQQ